MTCGTCRYLFMHADRDGVTRVRRDWIYRCDAPVLEISDLPDSVTGAFGFNWPPRRTRMTPDDGIDCPAYEEKSDDR